LSKHLSETFRVYAFAESLPTQAGCLGVRKRDAQSECG
jgi:hypothetical protein